MNKDFEPISLAGREQYLAAYAACPQHPSDTSFANLWGWAEEYGLEWAWGSQCVWIRQTKPALRYWAPVGPWDGLPWNECPSLAQGMEVIRVPETLALLWQEHLGDRLVLTEDRDNWDYLYDVTELIELRGNVHHKKKNHLNGFKKAYQYEYRSMTPDCVEEALALQAAWRGWHDTPDSPALIAENNAIERVLTRWDVLPGLMGGALHVGGAMVAFTVAEPLDKETLVIHFEKGQAGMRGVYQAINQMFLAHDANGYKVVNREQDLGDEGLRKAKLSYHPIGFLKKYHARILPR
ncbi:DUF2156 domain-containing protein [Megalodesulfovibrio gigas]|uniref:Phosphatidylglycerol lysyltransferase C-terminal domain-containing protein n=1 Tax=Megalodesulfovibrio gigas (strain ATCC 19364 / DSM 1382 / NCIMB 9332 / VKM B-1759) TaxID=1121448 RepID=T2GDH2_MEGG1|nr:phosphatidylglycerol lysyltransferase domain-containing protein [Megalodesulfovibrio gigas]AGW14610.1 hypothetical protein DGI_2883 [Megalodesulfovibrio gigas DSM 1382 = ATCC 19364]